MNMKDRNFTNPSLIEIRDKYIGYEKQFKDISISWNTRIRNFITDSMGIKLNYGNYNSNKIKVVFEPAQDESFFDLIEKKYPNLNFDELYRLNCFIEECKSSKEFFTESEAKYNLELAEKYAVYKLEKYDLKHLTEDIFNFLKPTKHDTFGCYYPSSQKVEIYIAPIVIYCRMNGIDLESFIVIHLFHEIVHGYSHVGYDKDGQYWKSFAKTDVFIIEGIAQYYTEKFIYKYQESKFELYIAFKELLKKQSNAYSAYNDWEASYEQVYFAFISSRRNNVVDYETFLKLLAESKDRIKSDF